jgi:DNA-binding response OmpR family regulator
VDLLRSDSVVDADTNAILRDNRIMLCEDDSDVAALLRAKLAKAGFEALIVATVKDALGHADRANCAAVLVDLNLPDGDGIGLIQELRARPRYYDKPIVVISANSKRGRNDLRAAALDVLDWLDKPVDIDRLVELLATSLDKNGIPGDAPSAIVHQPINKEVA